MATSAPSFEVNSPSGKFMTGGPLLPHPIHTSSTKTWSRGNSLSTKGLTELVEKPASASYASRWSWLLNTCARRFDIGVAIRIQSKPPAGPCCSEPALQ
eukprot:248524-Chlamydomonas_euryale.AAC.1